MSSIKTLPVHIGSVLFQVSLENGMTNNDVPIQMYVYLSPGITTGTFSTFLMCAAVHYYSRWPVGFYIAGGTQITWALIWILIVTDYPRRHPFISEEELDYLFNTISNIFPIKVSPHYVGSSYANEVSTRVGWHLIFIGVRTRFYPLISRLC